MTKYVIVRGLYINQHRFNGNKSHVTFKSIFTFIVKAKSKARNSNTLLLSFTVHRYAISAEGKYINLESIWN